ncbi:kelch-like protein 40 [Oculina patagonica]
MENRQDMMQPKQEENKREPLKREDYCSVFGTVYTKVEVTLLVKDGNEIKATRNMLSAASPFFSALLDSDMRENREGIIRLEHITDTVMRDVLEFMQSGTTEVTPTNVEDLIEAADYLLLPNLKIVAGRFLKENLTMSNCISIYYFAEKYRCYELVVNAREFVLSNFALVAESEEFLNLESQQVEQWISCNNTVVTTEKEIFEIILKWVKESTNERKGKFADLFRHVRLAFVTRDYLKRNVVTNKLVKETPGCLELVSDALKFIYHHTNGASPIPSRNWRHTHLVVLVGMPVMLTLCYDPALNKWYRLEGGMNVCDGDNLLTFQGKLYNSSAFTPCLAKQFDPFLNLWCSLHWKSQELDAMKMTMLVAVGGEMYAVVEHRESHRHYEKSKIIKYDIESSSWKLVSSFVFDGGSGTFGACAVGMDNYLYVIGGRRYEDLKLYAIQTASRFNIVRKTWEKIANMQQARFRTCGVAAHEKIFIAGGKIGGESQNSRPFFFATEKCEVYNSFTNEWHFIASLNRPRTDGSIAYFDGTLYVVGGIQYDESHNRLQDLVVESYNFKRNTWKPNTKIPISLKRGFSHFANIKACTLGVNRELLKMPIMRLLEVKYIW